jgi:hypothetical protein
MIIIFLLTFQVSDGEKSDQDLVVDDTNEVSRGFRKLCPMLRGREELGFIELLKRR